MQVFEDLEMKFKKAIILTGIITVIILFISGCEKVDVVEIDLPYHEKIVVQGFLVENQTFNGVTFTKTLPIDEVYSISKAELKDVTAYLKQGVRVIPLKYQSNGLYQPLNSFIPQKESVYELYAKWMDKNVYAKTFIPANPKIKKAYYVTNGSGTFIQAEIQNQVGAIFGAKYVIMEGSTVLYESEDIFSVNEPVNDPLKVITVRTPIIPKELVNTFRNKISIKVYAFDKQFQNYFKTKKYSFPIKDSFVQSGGDVEWNIIGDGIGLFIGYSTTTLLVN